MIEPVPLGNPGHLYVSRPIPYVLGQRTHLDRLPPFAFDHRAEVAPPVRPLAGTSRMRRPQRPVDEDELEDRRAFSRSEDVVKDRDAPGSEDRIIEALKLFKQLRSMAT
ncbi:hypothetical protein V5799_002557 [Amblyomma americanum]|uniref:Uncharacterized protein n=1 Tax=Amblyomma americanum TaxID=6943 RepID=A0AAQ4CWZ5_AMBAM